MYHITVECEIVLKIELQYVKSGLMAFVELKTQLCKEFERTALKTYERPKTTQDMAQVFWTICVAKCHKLCKY